MRSFPIIALCASIVGANPVLMRRDKTVVDEDTFQKFVYYLGFPRFTHYLATNVTCAPGNGGELIQYINVTSTDTQAALWKSTSTKEIILGIPGTSGDRDVFTDLEIALVSYNSPNVDCTDDCKVHDGFQEAWNSIEPAVSASLAKALSANPGYTTVVSGHSLGAAVAALAFASLVNGPYNVTAAYTYGQPRTGNKEFANYLDSLSGASDTEPGILHRVTHSNDGIPLVPPTLFGYRHTRTEYWESAHSSEVSDTYRCTGQEASDCINSVFGLGINKAHTSYTGYNVTCN